MSAPLLIMDKVSRIHGTGENTVHALTRVSLEVGAGELVAVMGPSGSGKSTLLNLAGALDQPTAGRVLIDGAEVSGLSGQALALVRRRKVGFVFQDFNLIPSLTAMENVAIPLELDGVSAKRAAEQARAALSAVGLDEVAERFPTSCPAGSASGWPSLGP